MLDDRALAVLFFVRDYLESQGAPPAESDISDFFNISQEETSRIIDQLVARDEIELQRIGRVIVLKNHRITVRNGTSP